MHLFWVEMDVEMNARVLEGLGPNYESLDRDTEIFFSWVNVVAGSRNAVRSQYLHFFSIRDFRNVFLSLIA